MAEIYVAKTVGLGGFEKLVAHQAGAPAPVGGPALRAHADRRGEDPGAAHARQHRPGVRPRLHRRHLLHRHGVRRGRRRPRAAEGGRQGCGRALPVPVCCFIVAEMLNGLDYAHRKRDHERAAAQHRAPRHLAAERADQPGGRGEAGRLRHRQDQPARARAPRSASSRASTTTCRPSRRGPTRSTGAATCSPRASCSTSCSPAACCTRPSPSPS